MAKSSHTTKLTLGISPQSRFSPGQLFMIDFINFYASSSASILVRSRQSSRSILLVLSFLLFTLVPWLAIGSCVTVHTYKQSLA
jgi:hypothetical protein